MGAGKLCVCVRVCTFEIILALLSLQQTCGGKVMVIPYPPSFQSKNMEFGEILTGAYGVINFFPLSHTHTHTHTHTATQPQLIQGCIDSIMIFTAMVQGPKVYVCLTGFVWITCGNIGI